MSRIFYISTFVILVIIANLFKLYAQERKVLTLVTAPEVKDMMKNDRVVLINSLTQIEYSIQHIPDSINIPLSEMKNAKELLINKKYSIDKNRPLVFYCMGKSCLYSRIASQAAIAMGYKKVYWFEGGIPEWYRFNFPMLINQPLKSIRVKKLSPSKVAKLIKKENVMVLDVRPTWWNTSKGMIKNTHFMPLVKLADHYAEIPFDRPIIISDGLMKQSPSAARFLIDKGFNILGVLKGGIMRWEKEGYPLYDKSNNHSSF